MDLTQEGRPAPALTPGARSTTALPKDSTDLLVEFSIALHKRAIYPLGHPHLAEAGRRFLDRLETSLAQRGSVAVGVAGRQLIMDGAATDPRNALLSDLAGRLHRHRIASLRFEAELTAGELEDLFAALVDDPAGPAGPLGQNGTAMARWPHLRLLPTDITRLRLDGDESGPPASRHDTPEGSLWLALAQLALSTDDPAFREADDPLAVARAIDDVTSDPAYDQVVFNYVRQIADALGSQGGAVDAQIQAQASRLIASLKPGTLRRILERGGDAGARQRLLETGSEVFGLEAVLEIFKAAAETSGQTISHQMLRLLHKLAQHGEAGSPAVRQEAGAVLRENVTRLIADWQLEDPNPELYSAVLESMGRHAPATAEAEADAVDSMPEVVLQIGFELDCDGPRVVAAIQAMLARGQLGRVTELLSTAPPGSCRATDTAWRMVASPALLRLELAADRVDFELVERLALRLRASAADPLLDLLERSEDRSVRARCLRILTNLGPEIGDVVAGRLRDAPWYVQRNLLALLRQLQVWPEGFSAVPYARHPDARIRQEAFKLLLDFPAHRVSAIARGLDDTDAGVLALVLRAAVDDCPAELLPAVERFACSRRQPAALRALAVRALAAAARDRAVPRLLELAGLRRRLFRWRLGAASPVVAAAVAELARWGEGHPLALRALATARRHADPEIRLAAGAPAGPS